MTITESGSVIEPVVVKTDNQEFAKSFVRALSQCYTGFVLDRLGKLGFMSPALKPLALGTRLCGLATTVSQSRRSGLNRSGQSAPDVSNPSRVSGPLRANPPS